MSEKQLYALVQNDENDELRQEARYYRETSRRRLWTYAILAQVALLAVYSGLAMGYVRHTLKENAPDIHAFAGLVVDYEMRKFAPFHNSTFAGEPRPETEEAWHNLMTNMTVRVTKEELDAHDQTSIPLPNGGYMAWIGAFHELHCVKILRHWSYREHYLPKLNAHEKAHHMVHVDHCLELLRNAAICRADTQALAVFKYDPSTPHPMLNTKRTTHRCVNWDAMMTSHEDRMVKREEVDLLRNPDYVEPPAGTEKPAQHDHATAHDAHTGH